MSTIQMLASGLKAKGFSVLQTYQDHLWKSGRQVVSTTIALLLVVPTDSNEEKVDIGLPGNPKSLTLEGEENGKDPLPEVSEDTSSKTPSYDSLDGKPLQEQTDELSQ